MTQKDTFIFNAVKVIVWIIFIGLCIEAGSLLINFIFTIFSPENVGDLYNKIDLSKLYGRNRYEFYGLFSFILAVAIMKAHLFYTVIELSYKLNLSKPFNESAYKKIRDISYYTFSIGIISHIGRELARNLSHKQDDFDILNGYWADSQAYIFMAAVIYIIALIFKKGLELQTDSELTI